MATETLDRSRSYGTHFPPIEGRYFYEQDGKQFGNNFERIMLPGEKIDPMAKARAAKAAKARGQANNSALDAIYDKPKWRRNTPTTKIVAKDGKNRRRKYPRGNAETPRGQPNAAPRPAMTAKTPEINLTDWAKGNVKYLFQNVREAVRSRFNIVVSNEADALGVLVREKVVTADEVPGYEGGRGDLGEGANDAA